MRGGLLFLLVMCLTLNGFSGPLVGGEISYTQIGTDSYLIELRMYRDCYASFPSVQRFDEWVNISVYDAADNSLIDWFRIRASDDSTRFIWTHPSCQAWVILSFHSMTRVTTQLHKLQNTQTAA